MRGTGSIGETAASRQRAGRAWLALTVVHPVPSAINALLVAALATVAGAEAATAGLLALAMLGFQFSIGALNDVADAEADRRLRPRKPIPAGHVSRPMAMTVVVGGAAIGLAISAAFGAIVLVYGSLGYASGVAYDVALRRYGLGWLGFAAAIPLLLLWTWQAAAGGLPPAWPLLLPLAALAGPALHLANGLVDVDLDAAAGRPTLATRLGPRRGRAILAVLMATIVGLGWVTLASLAGTSGVGLVAVLAATLTTAVGVALSWQVTTRAREAGWLLQAVGLATLAVAWLASTATR